MGHTILLLLIFAAVYAGFLLLAVSQKQNYARIIQQDRTLTHMSRPFRWAGFGLLALALFVALWRDGAAFGPILWAIALTIGASTVVVTLTVRPNWLQRLAALRSDRANKASRAIPPKNE